MTYHGSKTKKAYDTAYESSPQQVKHREERNRARAELAKEGIVSKGDGKDVDHATPLGAGGSNARKNLRPLPEGKNRGWRAGESGYKVKKVKT